MLVDLSYRVAAYEWYWSAMMCRVYVDFGLALSEAVLLVLFFFFQAEDGIRDKLVTGVQTYALPISPPRRSSPMSPTSPASSAPCPTPATPSVACPPTGPTCWPWACRRRSWISAPTPNTTPTRSEERRVGKEWRSRWTPDK